MKSSFHRPVSTLLLFAAIFISSCGHTYIGEGEIISQTREVGEFNGIALNMDAVVHVTDSLQHGCTVSAQQNLQEAIVTRVDGTTLVITTKGTVVTDKPIDIFLSMSRGERFEINGSGEIIGNNTLKNEKADFEVNGSGTIKMDIVTTKIACAVTGSGNLNLSGRTNSFDVEVNGSGTVNAFELSALTSKAKLNGSGQAFLNIGETLKASVSGSGAIKYRGQPKVTQDISGSGTIERAN